MLFGRSAGCAPGRTWHDSQTNSGAAESPQSPGSPNESVGSREFGESKGPGEGECMPKQAKTVWTSATLRKVRRFGIYAIVCSSLLASAFAQVALDATG